VIVAPIFRLLQLGVRIMIITLWWSQSGDLRNFGGSFVGELAVGLIERSPRHFPPLICFLYLVW